MLANLIGLDRFFGRHPLTRDNRAAAWMRFASWQVRSRLTEHVVVDWIEGQKLVCRRGMVGATGNIYTGLHEFPDMMLLLHFLREGELFLDVGANVGTYTVLAAGVAGANAMAFEPDPTTAAALTRNVEVNNLQHAVDVHCCAIGSREGSVSFTVGLDAVNRVTTSGEGETRQVPVRTLDGVVGERTPSMIKIDVEGYEEEVFKGASRVLDKPGLMVVEVETVTDEIERQLESKGFDKAFYDPFKRLLSRSPVGIHSNNAAYVRGWEAVSERLRSARRINVLGRRI